MSCDAIEMAASECLYNHGDVVLRPRHIDDADEFCINTIFVQVFLYRLFNVGTLLAEHTKDLLRVVLELFHQVDA